MSIQKIVEFKRQANIRKWSEIFSDRVASGQTISEYCREHGLSRDRYYYWLRIVREAAIDAMERQENSLVEIPTSLMDPQTVPSEDEVAVRSCPAPCIRIQSSNITVQADNTTPAPLLRVIMEVMQHA